ncbi:MAG: D-alanyl-D-alanine carboxypeptidase [Eubacteriales bacterium]|jgi:D-alanyl-D-alanine carboxypeptidase (penicillin-binding protein 5/6)
MSDKPESPEERELRKKKRAEERARKRKMLLIVSLIVVILAVLIVVVLIVLLRSRINAEQATVSATSDIDFDIEYTGEQTVFSSSSSSSSDSETSTSDSSESTDTLPTIDLTNVSSPYVIVERLSDGAVCAESSSTAQIYPASMTKIMTAIIAIENLDDLSDIYTFDGSEFDQGYANGLTTVGWMAGDTATYEDLLYGALLPSGADACYALANAVAGDESSFVELMNQKASELGMTGTNFTNCTGVQDTNHYTTCADMATLLKYALTNDEFRTVFTTSVYTTEPTDDSATGITMSSTLFMNLTDSELDNGATIEGGKTGYTDEAGHCLASLASAQDGTEYIAVTAGAAGGVDDSPQVDDAITIYSQLPGTVSYSTEDDSDVELDFGETIVGSSSESE